MKAYKINGYRFEELKGNTKQNVLHWIAETFAPLEYEKEDGTFGYDYWQDMPDDYIEDFCEINNFVFSHNGTPIHHLLK